LPAPLVMSKSTPNVALNAKIAAGAAELSDPSVRFSAS
jgi:hypothetical protein